MPLRLDALEGFYLGCDGPLTANLAWRVQRFGLEGSHSPMVQLTLDPVMLLLVGKPSFRKAPASKGIATMTPTWYTYRSLWLAER